MGFLSNLSNLKARRRKRPKMRAARSPSTPAVSRRHQQQPTSVDGVEPERQRGATRTPIQDRVERQAKPHGGEQVIHCQ